MHGHRTPHGSSNRTLHGGLDLGAVAQVAHDGGHAWLPRVAHVKHRHLPACSMLSAAWDCATCIHSYALSLSSPHLQAWMLEGYDSLGVATGAGRGGVRGRAWFGNAGPPQACVQQGTAKALPCLTLRRTCQPPVASRRSTRWRPRKPAPPVTRQRCERTALRRVATIPLLLCQTARGCATRLAAAVGSGPRAGRVAVCSLALLALVHALLHFLSAGRPRTLWRVDHVCALHIYTSSMLLRKHAQRRTRCEASAASQGIAAKERTFFMMASRFLGLPAMKTVMHDWDGYVAAKLEHLEAAIPSHATCPCLARRACRQNNAQAAFSSVLAPPAQ